MKTDCCPLCGNFEVQKKVHLEAMDAYSRHFLKEHMYARQELERLETMLRDIAWYNFEVVARGWKHPWPEHAVSATLELYGMRCELMQRRGGHVAEKCTFPTYYSGPVDDAPPLPPEIILQEVQFQRELVKHTEAACTAPYEWAPGGRLYEKMVRESEGVAAFSSKCSYKNADGGPSCNCAGGSSS